jgi:hypothetical protein
MKLLKAIFKFSIAPASLLAAATLASGGAVVHRCPRRIPHGSAAVGGDRLRAMQNSQSAMDLRDRVMPPELKQFDEALPSPA